MLRRFFFLLALSGTFFSLQAQEMDVYSQLAGKYPSENAVFVSRSEKAIIRIENDLPKIFTDNYEELLLLTDKVSNYAEHPVYFSSFSEITKIAAKTVIQEKGKQKEVKVSDFPITNEISAGTFYDDYKAKQVVFPALAKGSRAVLSYSEKLNEPRFYGRFFFNTYAPSETVEYSITVPEGIKISYKIFGITEAELNPTVTTSGKNTTYSWKAKSVSKYITDNDAPSISHYAPHIVVRIDEYTVKGKTVKLLGEPKDLYNWYYSMVKDVDTSTSPMIQHIADSLTTGITDEKEKVKKIFYWVQDNVKYVAFEDGMGGFVPRTAQMVCTRRFGDCKDMANIITRLLHAAGVKTAYLTWIGTRDIPYSYADVPAPLTDNHMISTYVHNGEYYFLDATGKNAPLGMHTSMIQGKEAMLGKGNGQFEIVKVPVIEKELNTNSDSLHLRFDNLATAQSPRLSGTGNVRLKGYEKILLGLRLQNMDEKERSDFLVRYLEKGSNKFNVDSLKYENLFDREKEMGIRYHWELSDYAQKNGNELYVNLNLDKTYMNELLDVATRKAPREIEFKNIDKHVTVLEIPAGYDVAYLPENARFENPDFGFEVTYTKKGNSIITEKRIWVNTLLIQPSGFDNWNKMIRQLTKAYNESVSLIKK